MLRTIKTLLFTCVALILPLSALAGGPAPTHHTQPRKASFYADAGIGIDILSSATDVQNQGTANAAPGLTVSTTGKRVANSSTAATLGFGYLFPVNNWFSLGARVFADYANNFSSIDLLRFIPISGPSAAGNESRFKLRNFEYGIDFTPSVNIGANQFLNGIFGVSFNKLTMDIINQNRTGNNQGQVIPSYSMDRDVVGARVGFSLEELLNPHFSIYMNYIWTGYGSIHSLDRIDSPIVNAIPPNGTFNGDTGITLETHKILVGLKYYFSGQNFQSHLRRVANHFNRLYVRLALGSLIPQYTFSNTVLATGAFPTYFYNRNQQASPTVIGVLGLGYGFLVHHFYLGAEAMLNAADRDSRSTYDINVSSATFLSANTNDVQIKLNTLEGAFDLKLGGIIAPQVLVFGRVGVALNRLELSSFALATNSASGLDIPHTIETKHTVVGSRFGLGLEKLFSDNFALTMNYVFTYYGHAIVSGTSPTVVNVSLEQQDAAARVSTHTVTIGANYYFS